MYKFIDSNGKCNRCDPIANCVTCDTTDYKKCLTCTPFEIFNKITNRCDQHPKLGMFLNSLMTGYDPATTPSSGFTSVDISKFTVTG